MAHPDLNAHPRTLGHLAAMETSPRQEKMLLLLWKVEAKAADTSPRSSCLQPLGLGRCGELSLTSEPEDRTEDNIPFMRLPCSWWTKQYVGKGSSSALSQPWAL